MHFVSLALAVQLSSGISGVEYLQPQLAADSEMVALTFGSRNAVYFAKSTDLGRSFLAPVKVSEGGHLALGFHRGPRVAIVPGAIVISAIVGRKGGGADGDLISWRSTDGGNTWSAGVRVNAIPDSAREGLHSMASGGRNTVFAAWLDLRSKGTKVYGAVSTDGGATWPENRLVYESPSGTVCECCHPSVLVDHDGRIHVMFRNVIAGTRDMYLVSPTDGGKTFSQARKLGAGSWKINACPAGGGSIAMADDSRPVSVWRGRREIYVAAEDDDEKLIAAGKNPVLAISAKGLYTAWTDSSGVRLLTPSQDDPAILDASGRYVQLLALSEGTVLPAWESGGTVRVDRLP